MNPFYVRDYQVASKIINGKRFPVEGQNLILVAAIVRIPIAKNLLYDMEQGLRCDVGRRVPYHASGPIFNLESAPRFQNRLGTRC
jgi:hypothetical protein